HLLLSTGQQINIVSGTEVAVDAAAALVAPAPAAAESRTALPASPSAAAEEAAEPNSQFVALTGKEVTITSRDTRSRTGVLTSVTAKQLTLSVRVGARQLDYFYSPNDVVSIDEVK